MSDAIEVWQPVPRFETRYAVSDQGRVMNVVTRRVLRPGRMPGGHLSVALGRGNSRCVHELVLIAFVGPRPPGDIMCRHLNGQPGDNRLANLSWATRGRNVQDYKWHGKPRKIPTAAVPVIREMLAIGMSERAIASIYAVAPNSIRNVRTGRAHADV